MSSVVDIDVLFGAVEGEGMMVEGGLDGLKAEPPLAADSIGNLDGLNTEHCHSPCLSPYANPVSFV